MATEMSPSIPHLNLKGQVRTPGPVSFEGEQHRVPQL